MQIIACCSRAALSGLLLFAFVDAVSQASCVCIRFPYINFGSYTLYYAHQFEDCPPELCNEFESIYVTGPPGLPPDECPDGCYSARFVKSKKYKPRLLQPLEADWDIHYVSAHKQPLYTVLTDQIRIKRLYYQVYEFKHPESNASIRTKIFFSEVTPKEGRNQKPLTVAFGLEVKDDGSTAIPVKTAHRHPGVNQYMYEFDSSAGKCVVLTSVP